MVEDLLVRRLAHQLVQVPVRLEVDLAVDQVDLAEKVDMEAAV